MPDDDKELSFVFKFVAGVLIIGVAVSGFAYWSNLSTKKIVNNIEYEARKSDPLVINTYQARSLELLASIESYQRKLKYLSPTEQKDVQISIDALEGELTQIVGNLELNQIPALVKAHRDTLNSK
jgi:hypothetical protein